MVTITDSYTFSVSIIAHGTATIILPVTFPATVEPSTAFNITYTVKNTGTASDNLYGHLLVNGVEVAGSYWSQNVTMNNSVTKTFTHSGIAGNTTFVIECGHI